MTNYKCWYLCLFATHSYFPVLLEKLILYYIHSCYNNQNSILLIVANKEIQTFSLCVVLKDPIYNRNQQQKNILKK